MSRRRRRKSSNKTFNLNHYQQKAMNNRKIKHQVDKNCEWWVDYDNKGNVIHKKTIFNFENKIIEFWIEYDDQNRETHYKRNDGFQYWCLYNKDGNISKYWDTTGYEESYHYYHSVVYKKDNFGNKVRREYNKERDGNLTIHNF